MESRRMIATVLFTDIVGSTERATAYGDRRWREVLKAHHAAVREELRRHHGHEIATAGDGFLAVFDSPAHALLCAAAIRDAVRGLDLAVRCGVHMGEIEHEDGDVGGIAVHIGARVAGLAGPDEILVSGTVRDAEAGSDFGFEDRGRHALKGVGGEWPIYALTEIPEHAATSLPPVAREQGFLARAAEARLLPVLVLYLAASAAVLALSTLLRSALGLPDWVPGVTVLLLVIGLAVIVATAWVQTHSGTADRRTRGLDLAGAARSVRSGRLPHLTWGRALAGGAFAFAMLFGVAGLWVVIQDRGRSFAPDEALADAAPGVAVLPFAVQGEGLDVWREGAVDLIGSNIDGAAGLRAIDSRTLLARWHEAVDESERPDLATSLDVARRTGARYALLGTAVALGRDLRLTADIYEVASGKSLGQAQVQGAPDSVYMLVDRLSIEALKTILGRPADDLPRVELARVTTSSLPALRAYLEGEVLYRKADWTAAIEAYQRAVGADSTFALAWVRLSEAISWLPSNARPEGDVVVPANQAARYGARLPEREAVLVRGNRSFFAGAMTMVEPVRSTSRRYPDDPELAYLLGEYYAHFDDQLLAEAEESARILARAIELDPTFAPYYQHPIESAFYMGDSARALELLSTFEKLAGGTFEARRYRLAAALAWGSERERAAALATLDTLSEARAAPAFLLTHPRFLEAGLASAEAQHRTGDSYRYVLSNLAAGRLGRVEEALREGQGLPGPGFVTAILLFLRQRGVAVDPERLRLAASADTLFPNDFFATLLAAEDGRAAEVRRSLEKARQAQKSQLEAGDTLAAARIEGYVQFIEGYSALERGERERALALLQQGQRQATGWGPDEGVNYYVRWSIAELLVELGRGEEAIPYYRSLRNDPYAALELGKIYEALGRREDAKEQFETALAYWREADPELAPRIAEARQRLAGLGFQQRG
ncbi:MAG TPA: adenylate/guanylate cyclase domain-containing protein [Gemmatimonadota bacterium]|nr:adenylate/guanylate cyclase domain-containing protein [Gemmatimonadota bacterium]